LVFSAVVHRFRGMSRRYEAVLLTLIWYILYVKGCARKIASIWMIKVRHSFNVSSLYILRSLLRTAFSMFKRYLRVCLLRSSWIKSLSLLSSSGILRKRLLLYIKTSRRRVWLLLSERRWSSLNSELKLDESSGSGSVSTLRCLWSLISL